MSEQPNLRSEVKNQQPTDCQKTTAVDALEAHWDWNKKDIAGRLPEDRCKSFVDLQSQKIKEPEKLFLVKAEMLYFDHLDNLLWISITYCCFK